MKAMLVDLDGTLIESHTANLSAYRAALDETGLPYSLARLEETVGKLAWPQMLQQVLPEHEAAHATIARRKREIYPRFFADVRVNKTLVSLLEQVHPGVKTALVTAASRGSVEPLLAAKALASLFDVVITSDDVSLQKPAPEPYIAAAQRLGVVPADCVVLEDSDVGIASARAFGAQIWQVLWS